MNRYRVVMRETRVVESSCLINAIDEDDAIDLVKRNVFNDFEDDYVVETLDSEAQSVELLEGLPDEDQDGL